MTCDGAGKLPCDCWASVASAPVRCTCKPCVGCEACDKVKAEAAAQAQADKDWYYSKVGTAPPKAAKGDKAKRDDQGRLF